MIPESKFLDKNRNVFINRIISWTIKNYEGLLSEKSGFF